MLVLDSGGLSRLAERSSRGRALHAELAAAGLWPPLIPSAVLIESLTGDGRKDAAVNRVLATCEVQESVPRALARAAARLRTKARHGSAVDALVVATADPGGTVLTSDVDDIEALAAFATDVHVERA